MPADNSFIADQFSLLSKLMDIHGENSFKSKSYSIAAFTIDKLPEQVAEIPPQKLSSVKGIGDSAAKKIMEILQTGKLQLLEDLVNQTPPGVLEMLHIKGLGPKKIATVWKELELESMGELLYACNENRLLLYKGFGEKTQQNIKESIEFYLSNIGSYLFSQTEEYALAMKGKMETNFPGELFLFTGDFRQHKETIDELAWVTTAPGIAIQNFFLQNNYTPQEPPAEESIFIGPENIQLHFYHSNANNIYQKQFITSCSESFLLQWMQQFPFKDKVYKSEEEIFSDAGVAFIPAYMREKENIIAVAEKNQLPDVIQAADITGIIHSHSNWSDGVNTPEEMAKDAIAKGLQYLVLSDHSKSAFYANGLQEDRIRAQHAAIDELNKQMHPFKIFKSIESDILNDGSLDYGNEILSTFDIIIASVHSNLKMNEEKAMMRLMKAIENPYTSILGHMTGRLLLSRNGYPVNHQKIIDACAANNVVIELNAHPRRLDIDWRWIDYCLKKNVLISIDPDAHSVEGYKDTRYGVLVAQKAGVRKEKNLSSFSLHQFEKFVEEQKAKRIN